MFKSYLNNYYGIVSRDVCYMIYVVGGSIVCE